MHIIGGSRKGMVTRKDAKIAKHVSPPLGMLHAKTLRSQNMFLSKVLKVVYNALDSILYQRLIKIYQQS